MNNARGPDVHYYLPIARDGLEEFGIFDVRPIILLGHWIGLRGISKARRSTTCMMSWRKWSRQASSRAVV